MTKPTRRVQVAFISLLILSVVVPLSAHISFSRLSLREPSDLTFQVTLDATGIGSYGGVFYADVESGDMHALTFFPEEVHWLSAPGQVQIRNRLGTYRIDPESGRVAAVEHASAFADGDEIPIGLLASVESSPDGRYLLFQRPQSAGYASLVLLDTLNGEEHVVAEAVARTAGEEIVRFSPDGRYFVYARDGSIYIFPLENFRDDRLMDESFRRLGRGGLENVRWSGENTLFIMQGRLVHRVAASRLFARSLYQDIIDQAEVVGRLPFLFDSSFDEFWVGPYAEMVLVNRGGRNLFLTVVDDRAPFPLEGELPDGNIVEEIPDTGLKSDSPGLQGTQRGRGVQQLPFLYLPPESSVKQVLWSEDNVVSILVSEQHSQRDDSDGHSTVRRIVFERDLEELVFERIDSGNIRALERSPDGERVAVVEENRVVIRDHDSWNTITSLDRDSYLAARWIDNQKLFVAGRRFLSVFSPERSLGHSAPNSSDNSGERLLALSQADDFGFSRDSEDIVLRQGAKAVRVVDSFEQFTFTHAEDIQPAEPSTAVEEYRVFTDDIASRTYDNRVLVRDLGDGRTRPLFEVPEPQYAPFPETEGEIDFRNFKHGSRLRARQVALSVNAIGSDEGLVDILRALDRYDFRATFFLNGDFIRRNPASARSIANSRHEVGNLFSNYIDLTDAALGIDERFVQQGLSETEDLYFEATGQELSLLWHAPHYLVASDILDAAEELGYRHVGRDVESLDHIPRYTEAGRNPLYRPAAELINRIVDRVKPGSIVDLTLGIPGETDPIGGRDDYLYHRIEVLLNALISRGYDVVPVSVLIDKAQEGVQ